MRVNVYAEEMTDLVEIVEKKTADGSFTGVRFHLELPATVPVQVVNGKPVSHDVQERIFGKGAQLRGKFQHGPDDDDSAAVTFWGKKDLRAVLQRAINLLDEHHGAKKPKRARR
jgi:hypothetical protein